MVVRTNSEKAVQAHRTTLEFLLVNHPIDCPVCDQAGECYLQDQYMEHGLHDSKVQPEEKVRKRKVVDLGPIMLDAERCVLCSRCIRFEANVTGTNSFEFVNRGDPTQIATFQNRPIEHNYAGNLADVCPVGALLSHDFRFKMRVWFLEATESVCPVCSTGCNVFIDHRDGEAQRLRPRRNVEVNKSWMCDIGRRQYKEVALDTRVTGARLRSASGWEGTSNATALDLLADRLRTFVAVMATHDEHALDRAQLVLPAAMWAVVDGTFTNYQRGVQRMRRAYRARGAAVPRWELAAGVLKRLQSPLAASSAREV